MTDNRSVRLRRNRGGRRRRVMLSLCPRSSLSTRCRPSVVEGKRVARWVGGRPDCRGVVATRVDGRADKSHVPRTSMVRSSEGRQAQQRSFRESFEAHGTCCRMHCLQPCQACTPLHPSPSPRSPIDTLISCQRIALARWSIGSASSCLSPSAAAYTPTSAPRADADRSSVD